MEDPKIDREELMQKSIALSNELKSMAKRVDYGINTLEEMKLRDYFRTETVSLLKKFMQMLEETL